MGRPGTNNGGTGTAPDNGTNDGECDECCGSGVFE